MEQSKKAEGYSIIRQAVEALCGAYELVYVNSDPLHSDMETRSVTVKLPTGETLALHIVSTKRVLG